MNYSLMTLVALIPVWAPPLEATFRRVADAQRPDERGRGR
jgi:hypothetical protein